MSKDASGPIVIKIGGTTLEEQSSQPTLWSGLVQLSSRHPGGVVLLHGGGKVVDKHLSQLGFTTERKEGIRITPKDQVQQITAILAGMINKSLVTSINQAGGKGVGLCLGDGGLEGIITSKATHYSFDPGMVGEVTGAGNAGLLRLLLREGYFPVVSSIGISTLDGFLNVNADDAAAGVAMCLKAHALVLLTDVPGVLDGQKQVIPTLNQEEIDGLIASGVISGGMVPKVRAALGASKRSGAPVHILSGNDPASLLGWARGERVGTRIWG